MVLQLVALLYQYPCISVWVIMREVQINVMSYYLSFDDLCTLTVLVFVLSVDAAVRYVSILSFCFVSLH